MRQFERQLNYPRSVEGYALDAAAKLEAASPHFLLKLLCSSSLVRQTFFAFASEADLDRPQDFLDRAGQQAPNVLADLGHLDPLAQIARALILMKPRTTIQALYGECPDGFMGLLSRLGSDPLDRETYRKAFQLFADPCHRHRATVLGQMPGEITAGHIAVVAGLDDALVHRAVVEKAKTAEVQALNRFVTMIRDLCGAMPESIKYSLDKLHIGTIGVGMNEWAQGWLGRQKRLQFEPPIPATDSDFKLCLGVELTALGRRLRNCASQRKSYTFLAERLIYEVMGQAEPAALELLRLTTAGQTRWVCEDLRGARNRRVSPEMAAWVQMKLDEYSILYQSLRQPSVQEQMLHKLVDHTTPFAWDMRRRDEDDAAGDADLVRMLDELEQEVHGQEAA